MGEMYGRMPHELLLNRLDVPGEYIPMSHMIFSIQATDTLAKQRKKAHEDAAKQG